YTRETNSEKWAITQNNLGIAYRNRIRGERAENLERAIQAYQEALTVYTREAFPQDWAMTQNNLGNVYGDRIRGERAENLERAIQAFEAATTVYTRETNSEKWAITQNNLGNAYSDRIRGERAENLERAIRAFEAALTVRTREAFPENWAMTQNNLGATYSDRIRGERAENLERAIQAYQATLTIYTSEASPRDHIKTSGALGRTLVRKGEWVRARQVFDGAVATAQGLLGDGLDQAEVAGLIAETGSLFTDAASADAHDGALWPALVTLEDGRGRLLRAALRLESLALSPADRDRMNEFRAVIAALERQLAQPDSIDRGQVLGALAEQRRQLRQLVDRGSPPEREEPIQSLAGRMLPEHGAIVAPILTGSGAELLVVAGTAAHPEISRHPLSGLTNDGWREQLYGPADDPELGNWLGAYAAAFHTADPNGRQRWDKQMPETANALWRLIGRELAAALKARGIAEGARVLWLAQGMLDVIPIDLAQDPDSKRTLLDAYEFVTLPSLRGGMTNGKAAPAATPTLAALINPAADPKLIFTPIEGALVSGWFKPEARASLGPGTKSVPTVLEMLAGRSYWHLSSHGAFAWGDPLQSSILLAGGEELRVEHLLERFGRSGAPRLVVLSACEVGLADIDRRRGEEFVGFPMAFLAMGAHAVIAPHWPVSDLATMFLLARFYELHLGRGEQPATALRHARLWLRDATKKDLVAFAFEAESKGIISDQQFAAIRDGGLRGQHDDRPFAHPTYWAGFTITGL
ncbi:MAG: CHAT domain-containing protein, partial [Rhodospirillaceae bacterium]